MIKKYIIIILGIFSLVACTQVDDYVLGKDNTPKPESLKKIASTINIKENWSIKIGEVNTKKKFAKLQPVVTNNTIYVVDSTGVVQAINTKTANPIWAQATHQHITLGPILGEKHIIMVADNAKIIALDKNKGTELWQQQVIGDIFANPVISHDKVLIKTINGFLYAFNLHDGKKLWSAEHETPNLIVKASSAPIVFKDLVLVGCSDGKLDAFDIQTGKQIWQRGVVLAQGASDVERLVDIDADPVVKNDKIFLASYQGFLGAISLLDGQVLWQKPVAIYKNMATDIDSLYVIDSEDVVWALDANNGQVKWKQTALKARGLTEPVIANGNIVVADREGFVHVLSAHNGDFISRIKLNGKIASSLTVANNTIYLLASSGKLTSLTLAANL